jgi:hypothetical protein
MQRNNKNVKENGTVGKKYIYSNYNKYFNSVTNILLNMLRCSNQLFNECYTLPFTIGLFGNY